MMLGQTIIAAWTHAGEETSLDEVRGGQCFYVGKSLLMSTEQYDDSGNLQAVRVSDGKAILVSDAIVHVVPVFATLAQ